MTERTKTIKGLISGQVDIGTFGLVELELINTENEIIKKDKLILDLTDTNNCLIKENKLAWDIVQEYRGDICSGEHLSINNLMSENKRLKDELMDLMINVFGEIERRQALILSEDNDLIKDTMIENLLIDIPRAEGKKFK